MAPHRKSEKAKDYGVNLTTQGQKDEWERISQRETMPSRYPHEFPLTTLGILEDFWNLCNVGDDEGLVYVFRGTWPSYRKLTLEFLSTLKVHRESRTRYPKKIDFRLGNRNHTLSMGDLCDIFHCHESEEGLSDLSHSEIWRAFTIKGETEEFGSGKAKSTAIRNPVLRYLHRAMTQLIFARVDGGGVSQVELEVMECLLLKRGVNLGVLWTNYVDRIIKKEGVICCGGLITCLARHLGVSTDKLIPDQGEMNITYEVLFAMEFLKIDMSGQGFFIPAERDHFPVPNPYLTKVDVWTNQGMWKLNTPVHRRCIRATPIDGEFKKKNMPRLTPHYDPEQDPNPGQMEIYNEEEGDQGAQGAHEHGGGNNEEEEEDEEEVERHRRRNRARARHPRPVPQDEFQRDMTAQMGNMFSYMQNMSNTWDTRWAEQQQENAFNRQSWAGYNQWQTVEQGFWEAQRLQDVQQRQELAEMRRTLAEMRGESQAQSSDMTYLVDAMENLQTHFPPPS